MQSSPNAVQLDSSRPIQLFLSYAHADRRFCLRLEAELSRLAAKRLIDVWSDREIQPGEEWEKRITAALDQARIILLLISLEFLESRFCRREMQIALERRARSGAFIIPVPLTKRGWEKCKLHELQAVPVPPVEDWNNDDEALADITRQLENLVQRSPKIDPPSYAHFGPDAPLLVSLNSGAFGGGIGGIIGGILAGVYIAWFYRSGNPQVGPLHFIITVLFVGVGGALLGFAVHWSILWFRRLAIRKHFPGFLCNELVGACVGGAFMLGLVGAVAGALFQPYGGTVIDPQIVVPAVLGGTLFIPIGILFYGFKRARAAALTSALLALSVIFEAVVWYIVRPSIDLGRYCANTGPWPCARGGGLYLSELGVLVGFCVGATVLVHRRLRELKTRSRIQANIS